MCIPWQTKVQTSNKNILVLIIQSADKYKNILLYLRIYTTLWLQVLNENLPIELVATLRVYDSFL